MESRIRIDNEIAQVESVNAHSVMLFSFRRAPDEAVIRVVSSRDKHRRISSAHSDRVALAPIFSTWAESADLTRALPRKRVAMVSQRANPFRPFSITVDISFDTRYNFEIIKSKFAIAYIAAIRNIGGGIHRCMVMRCALVNERGVVSPACRGRYRPARIGETMRGALHWSVWQAGVAEQKAPEEASCWS
jgi:hypothetical protein